MEGICERIEALLKERGISGSRMSADLGMSRSFMTCLSYCIPRVLPGYRRDVCWNMEISLHSATGTKSITM